MSKFHYCTIASNNHFFKVIALRNSLKRQCSDYCLTILCYNNEVYEVLSAKDWNDVKLLQPAEIEDEALLAAKSNRHAWEYAWTLKPALLKYVMSFDKEAEYFSFLDADIYFFANPNEVFGESPGSDIFLTDHNNSPKFLQFYDISGKFNSGFVGCKNTENAINAVDWWRGKAIDWCYARFDSENKRYGDQRYLEEFPALFPNIHIITSKGVNAAHWNIENYKATSNGAKVFLDGDKLVFYHYSGLFIYDKNEYNLSWATHIPEDAVQYIYLPYLHELKKIIEEVEAAHPAYKTYGFSRAEPGMELHRLTI